MTTDSLSSVPIDVDLVSNASEEIELGLLSLAVPEAMTDELAFRILKKIDYRGSPAAFIDLVRSCDFVVDRHAEWRLSDEARSYLRAVCRIANKDVWSTVNGFLLSLAVGETDDAVAESPYYLSNPAASAFHLAAVDPEAGLERYVDVTVDAEFEDMSRTAWLANRLATEQAAIGIFPSDAEELLFIRAMGLYNSPERKEGVEMLRPLAARKGSTMQIAVALHLVGYFDSKNNPTVHYRIIEKALRRSLRIGRSRGSDRHVAQVQHTLALLLLKNDRDERKREAYELLDESLRILRRVGDDFGVAKVLHTYGQALQRERGSSGARRSRQMLVESLTIGQRLGKRRHEAAVLRSLAENVASADPELSLAATEAASRLDGAKRSRK